MVKLKGPALGQRASGSLAQAVIFSNSRGRAYLKKSAKPKQPRTKPQVAMRAAATFLSPQWSVWVQAVRDTWIPKAKAAEISPFNAYQRDNLARLRNHLAPSAATPPTLLGNHASIDNFSVTGFTRRLRVKWNITNPNQGWGFKIFHVSGTGITPLWSDLIGIAPSLYAGPLTWWWQQNVPGLYWIAYTRFAYTGWQNPAAISWLSGTVT